LWDYFSFLTAACREIDPIPNVAGLRALHCFQKNIDASKMSDWQRCASETLIRRYGPNARWSDSKGNLQP
jgi:hypothetical protein